MEIEQIKQAIAALEAQRASLGESVVDAALAPLRQKLAALQAYAGGEQRKTVTVLFSDLAGFTALSARLDAEDVRELMNSYFTAWKTAIEAQGGSVEKFIGDAVMAVFGLPAAHEDDPERAIRSALDMRTRLDRLNAALEPERGFRLAMRVGINTGEVVVSTLGERQGEPFVVVGEVVNLASRLQAAAPEGGILIAHDSYRLVRGIFNLRELEPLQVKGREAPLPVYLVLGAKPRAFRMATRGVEGVETRMVGREADLKRLQDAFWEAVEVGERRVVTVVGEAGLGKSRLVYEFGNWLDLLPEIVVYFKGRGYLSTRNSPFSLLRSVFAFRFEIQDSDAPPVVWEKLSRGLGDVLGKDGTGIRKADFIGRLLGFELGGILPWNETLTDAGQFHEQALAHLGDYFRGLAQQHPVVVLLEDLHWADDSSLDLIYRLEGSLAQYPLLIVGTARPELFEGRPNWGEGLSFHTRLDLQALSRRESRQLLAEILQKMERVPEKLQDLLVGRAEGNPFFIEEGIKMLIEEGVIEKSGERWQVTLDGLTGVTIPHTLTGVLQARLDSLDPEQRFLLQRAAVIGRTFWDRAVEYLGGEAEVVAGEAGDSDGSYGGVSARELLAALRAREIVFQRERSTFEDAWEYLFKHTLLRDVAYESLLKRQRRVYHARAARWLERAMQPSQRADEFAALIALHYEQAGEPEPAAAWYRRAGVSAAAHYANSEAVHAFSRALELTPAADLAARYELILRRERVLDRQGARGDQWRDLQELDRLAAARGEAAVRAEAALRRANYFFATGDYPAAVTAAREAVELAQRAGLREKEAEGTYLWGHALDFQQARPEALAKLERALELARQAQLPRLEADVLMSLGPHFSDLNKYAEARQYLTAALQIFRRLGDRRGEAKALGNLGVTAWGQGDRAGAKTFFEASREVVREVGDRRVESILLGNLGVIAHDELRYTESQRWHLQALEISREISNRHSECITLSNLAEIDRDLGNFSQAEAAYRQALVLAQELDLLPAQCGVLLSWSQLLEYQGEDETALEHARRALSLAQEVQSPLYESGSHVRLGHLLLKLNRADVAAGHFQRALDLQRSLGLENRAMESLAGLANASAAAGEAETAQSIVETILLHLETHDLLGTDEPLRVYLTCFRVLKANADARARDVLAAGHRFLLERLDTIEAENLRRSFLKQIPWNRQLVELWRAAQGSAEEGQ